MRINVFTCHRCSLRHLRVAGAVTNTDVIAITIEAIECRQEETRKRKLDLKKKSFYIQQCISLSTARCIHEPGYTTPKMDSKATDNQPDYWPSRVVKFLVGLFSAWFRSLRCGRGITLISRCINIAIRIECCSQQHIRALSLPEFCKINHVRSRTDFEEYFHSFGQNQSIGAFRV